MSARVDMTTAQAGAVRRATAHTGPVRRATAHTRPVLETTPPTRAPRTRAPHKRTPAHGKRAPRTRTAPRGSLPAAGRVVGHADHRAPSECRMPPACTARLVVSRVVAVVYRLHGHHVQAAPAPTRAGTRTTAQVARAAPPSGRDFRFGTSSSPPRASAAASATDGVPTAASGAADGCGTGTPARKAAGYARTGTPSRAAASVIPVSRARLSTVASSTTSAADSPAPHSVSSIRRSISAAETPGRAPTPTTRADAGCAPEGADRLSRGPWRSSSRSARSS